MTAPPKTIKGSAAGEPVPATGIEQFSINRVALVSHDYNETTAEGDWDYASADFRSINALCDELKCDAILYSSYTLSRHRAARLRQRTFDGAQNLRAIFVEVCDFTSEGPENMVTQAWLRGHAQPFPMQQRFGKSGSSMAHKQRFVDDLPSRRFGNVLFILCGESNIVRTNRDNEKIEDPYNINCRLRSQGISVVLNPVHDYIRRFEIKEKRRYLSQGGRTVMSVWNLGKGREPKNPWAVFHDQHDRTDEVEPINPSKYGAKVRDDVRIGIVDMAKL